MFPTTSSVDLRLSEAAAALEAADPALRVIAGRIFRLPYARVRARAALQNPRRFNILEEFVLRAAAELAPPPAPAELAALLGLDPLFVDATLAQLQGLKALGKGREGPLALTPLGRQFLKDGQALQPAEHKQLSLLYRAGVDTLTLWAAPSTSAGQAPVLPGVSEAEREKLMATAQAAATAERVGQAAAAGGLDLHNPAEGRLLTGVDQVTVDDIGFYACGVLVAQALLTGQAGLRAINLDSEEPDPELQRRLDDWLKAGRIHAADFLAPAEEREPDRGAAPSAEAAEPPEYQRRFLEKLAAGQLDEAGVELLRGGGRDARSRSLLPGVRHTLLLFLPRLSEAAAGEALRAQLETLAARGVVTVIGWGTADSLDEEPQAPAAGVVAALDRLRTPDGLPAAIVCWAGSLYGQDAVADFELLVSSVPNTLLEGGQRVLAGSATYVVSAPDLVSAAMDDLEPALARAARQSWAAGLRAPESARQALARCCQTWIAIRRPGEALSHILKLAATLAGETEDRPDAMLVAWQLLSGVCLSLARLPAERLAGMGAAEALRRAIPEFLDWADSALPPVVNAQPPFVAAFHDLLLRYSQHFRGTEP